MATKTPPVDIRALVREHYKLVSEMGINDKCAAFTQTSTKLSDTDRTLFAQWMIRNFCSYNPDLYLAKFYLSQMVDIHRPPADHRIEHPLLQELAHQCESFRDSGSTENELLFLLFDHPCYKPYLHSHAYTDKYGCTFLDRYLVSRYYDLEKKDTPLRTKLKELFPKEYPVLMAKAIAAGKTFDPIMTYTGRGGYYLW